MSTADEDDDQTIRWPAVVETAVDNPAYLAERLNASRLPPDAKRIVWRHLKATHPTLVSALSLLSETFPGYELRLRLSGRGARIQQVLKPLEGKGLTETTEEEKPAKAA